MTFATANLGYLTADLPGIGGVIKQRPEDFVVEELPLYEAAGEGEHLYVFVEKRSRTTSDVIRHIAKAFRISKRDIGYAGLKDKHAITRQCFSLYLPGLDADLEAESLARIDNETVKLLWAKRHGNKLRRGHLRGNRFEMRVREVDPDAMIATARTGLERLAASGVPNFLGSQRFGYRQNNHIMGRFLLLGHWQALLDEMLGRPSADGTEGTDRGRTAYEQGDFDQALAVWPRQLRPDRQALDALRQGKDAQHAVMSIDKDQRVFLLSGLQSAVFNRVLNERLAAGTFDRLLPGDLAMKHLNRAVFTVDETIAAAENAPGGRIHTREISPTGPMWGGSMMQADHAVGETERRILAEFDLTEADFENTDSPQPMPEGVRRPLRIFLDRPDIAPGEDEHGPYLRVCFDLPRGSFATIVLREIIKVDDLEARRNGGQSAP